MSQKTNLTFVTLTIKVTSPKQTDFLTGLWGSYIPGIDLIAVILFELTDRHTDTQTDSQTNRTIT